LNLYRDPTIAANTATSDFAVSDLIAAGPPVSLYLAAPPSDIDRIRPLIRLVLNQIGRRLTERLPSREGGVESPSRRRLLLMLDEFPTLGRLPFFESALAYLPGYGIKAYLIAQDLAQLYAAYGHDESIVSNCHVRIAYAPNRIETANLTRDRLDRRPRRPLRPRGARAARPRFRRPRTSSPPRSGELGIRELVSILRSSTPVILVPSWISTPISRSSCAVRVRSASGNEARIAFPASMRTIRAAAASM
jgi:Type IV secretory system Conjugative DNA transfer